MLKNPIKNILTELYDKLASIVANDTRRARAVNHDQSNIPLP